MSEPLDPEDVTQLQPADLAEVSIDETPDAERPQPLEADPGDAAEQRIDADLDEPDGDLDDPAGSERF